MDIYLISVPTRSSEAVMNYQRRIAAIKFALGITYNKYEDENDPENMRSNLLGMYNINM